MPKSFFGKVSNWRLATFDFDTEAFFCERSRIFSVNNVGENTKHCGQILKIKQN